jgi:hypothetical protein
LAFCGYYLGRQENLRKSRGFELKSMLSPATGRGKVGR